MALNILVVDDSALTRKAIKRIIGMVDIEVDAILEAENGCQALELLRGDTAIDIVLADLNMPEMNGIEMIHEMQTDDVLRSIPVAIVSTESSTRRIDDLLSGGAVDYLHKPFTPEQFRELLLRTVEV